MIVVDANVIAYWSIEGELTEYARKLRVLESEWAVPSLCRHELANVLVSYVRHGGMEIRNAREIWPGVLSVIMGNEYEVDLVEAIQIAAENEISAYDAQYIVLSQRMRVPLITEDKRLCRQYPETTCSIRQYLEQINANG